MKTGNISARQRRVGNARALRLAQQIERIRKSDPDHYARILRKIAELEQRYRK